MKFSYKPLWKKLIDLDMTKAALMDKANISKSTMYKLTKDENITTDTLLKICIALECDLSEIMECIEDDK